MMSAKSTPYTKASQQNTAQPLNLHQRILRQLAYHTGFSDDITIKHKGRQHITGIVVDKKEEMQILTTEDNLPEDYIRCIFSAIPTMVTTYTIQTLTKQYQVSFCEQSLPDEDFNRGDQVRAEKDIYIKIKRDYLADASGTMRYDKKRIVSITPKHDSTTLRLVR
jgi:hypothetical protein